MMTTKSNSNSNRDDLISAAQYEGIKLAPALSHAQLVGHEIIDEEIWYQVVVQPKPVTVMKHAQTVSFHRKPYTIYRRYEDFQCFTHQLCEEFEQNAELLRQLSTCIGAAFDNEFDQNITQEQRQEDLGTFLVQLFETSHIVLTSRPVMEFLGRWHTDDDLSLRCKEALNQMRRPRNQRTRSLNDIRSAMKQHAAQLLSNKSSSKSKPFIQGHRPTRSGSSHNGGSANILLSRQSSEGDRPLMGGGSSSHGPLPPFNITSADDDATLIDDEPCKARMRKVRSFTHVRARVSSLFTSKRSNVDDDCSNGNDAYRRGRQGRRGSEGSTLSIRRTSSGQSQTITPSEDGSMSYGLPSDFKLPDVDSKRTTELFSDLNAILQQNNISSPQGEPALSELLQTTGRDRLKQHQHHRGGNSNHSSVDLSNSSFDQYLPSSMKRNTGTTSPPVSQSGNGNATTSTLARFLKQAVAHRDSCSSSPVSSLANGGTTPYLSPPNSNSSTSFKQDSSTRRQSMGGKRKSVTANNSPILSGKNDLQLLKPNSLGNDSVTVMVATVTNFTPGVNGTGEVPMTRARSASAVHRRNGSHTGISNTTPIPERSPQRNGADRRSTLVTNSNSNNAAAATTGNGGNQPSVDSSDASHVIVIVRVDSTREVRIRLARTAQFSQLRNALWKEVSRIPGLAERMSGRLLLYTDPNNPDAKAIRVLNDNALQQVMAIATGNEILLCCSKSSSSSKSQNNDKAAPEVLLKDKQLPSIHMQKDTNAALPALPNTETTANTKSKPLPPAPANRPSGKGALSKLLSAFVSNESSNASANVSVVAAAPVNGADSSQRKPLPIPPPIANRPVVESETTSSNLANPSTIASEVPLTPALIEQLNLNLPRGSFGLIPSSSSSSALPIPPRVSLVPTETPETPMSPSSPPATSWYRLSEHLESCMDDGNNNDTDNDDDDDDDDDAPVVVDVAPSDAKEDIPVAIEADINTATSTSVQDITVTETTSTNTEMTVDDETITADSLTTTTITTTSMTSEGIQQLVTPSDRRPSVTLELAQSPMNAARNEETTTTTTTAQIESNSNSDSLNVAASSSELHPLNTSDITLSVTPVSPTNSADSPNMSPSSAAPWMDPDVARKIGLDVTPSNASPLEETAATTTTTTEETTTENIALSRSVSNRMTSSFSSAFAFMLSKDRVDTDNQSLSDHHGDNTLKARFQTAASGLVNSLGIRRGNSILATTRMTNKQSSANDDETSSNGTETTSEGMASNTDTNQTTESIPVVPPPRLSSKSNLDITTTTTATTTTTTTTTNSDKTTSKPRELSRLQKMRNKRSFIEQLRQAQAAEEEQAKAEQLAEQNAKSEETPSNNDDETSTTSNSNGTRRLLRSVRSESRLLVTKQVKDTSRLDITVQLDEQHFFLLQAMRNVEYASLRASIWAELIRRQMPESLFAGKALVYRGTHGELTVSGDGPLREAVDDCLGGGNHHLVFHCI